MVTKATSDLKNMLSNVLNWGMVIQLSLVNLSVFTAFTITFEQFSSLSLFIFG